MIKKIIFKKSMEQADRLDRGEITPAEYKAINKVLAELMGEVEKYDKARNG